MDTIRYGLIGAGMMGQEHLRNIALIPGSEVTAMAEPDAGMAAAARALAPNARIVDDLEALLQLNACDALVIASPNFRHVEQLEAIAARAALPILCEKPLYTRPEDEARVLRLAHAHPAPIWVGMEYRYMQPIAELLRRAPEATGGVRMLTIREHRFPFKRKVGDWNRLDANTGGTLVEKCCHFFDLMRLILRSEPVRVMASAGQDVNHKDEQVEGRTPDVWDAGYVIVDFASGARAMLELCMYAEGSEYQEDVCAVGPLGKIEAKVPPAASQWTGVPVMPKVIVSPRAPQGPREIDLPLDPTILMAGEHHGATFHEHLRFAAAVRGTGAVEVTLADGAAAVRMGLAAQESARTGRAVTLHAPSG